MNRLKPWAAVGAAALCALCCIPEAAGQSSRPTAQPRKSSRSSRDAAPPPMAPSFTPAQIAAMQTKELKSDFDTAFRSAAATVHELGWQIDLVDKDAGLIQASSFRTLDVIGPEDDARTSDPIIEETREGLRAFEGKEDISMAVWTRWDKLTVLLEPWGAGTVRARISIVKYGTLPSGLHYYPYPKAFGYKGKRILESAKEQSMLHLDPKTYEVLFQQIRNAIVTRQRVAKN